MKRMAKNTWDLWPNRAHWLQTEQSSRKQLWLFFSPQRFIRIPDSLVWQTDTSRVNLMKRYQSQAVLVFAGSSKYGSFGFNWVSCLQSSSVRSLKMLMSCRKTPPFFIASLISKTALVVPTQAYITNYKQCVMNDTVNHGHVHFWSI